MATLDLMTGRFTVILSVYSLIFLLSFGEMSLVFVMLWK